ncbi:Not1 N-terminal domain, CCR4-Not complex component-domain-containing protein [Zopfochytrium polystomum]|nr:Not1 N-terminal domain, CCR4-Not complex component-domain-containing protein [Zopfochytrium polystomum]
MALKKLQAEIDKTLKKVAEGVEVFESTYDKIQAAPPTQKEKLEGELKKEIKKLQRYRDQIKGWLASNEIKDKRALTDNRKLIETQMERFKACEKELKTKAYSKEGLSAAVKVDPLEREKAEISNWITETVDKLQTQIDAFEAEAETVQVSVKKSRKADPSKAERLTRIEHWVERHKFHQHSLEVAHRMLENGELEVAAIKGIREDVNYYADNNQDAGFEEDEGLYDELNLQEGETFLMANEDDDSDSSDDSPVHRDKGREKETPKVEEKKKHEPELTSPSKAAPSKAPVTPVKPGKAMKPPTAPTPKTTTPAKPAAVSAAARPPLAPTPAAANPPVPPQRYAAAAAAASISTPERSASVSSTTNSNSDDKRHVPRPMSAEPPVTTTAASAPSPATTPARNPVSQAAEVATPPPQAVEAHPPSASVRQAPPAAPPKPEPSKENYPPPASEPIDNRLPPSLADLVDSFEVTKKRSTEAKDDATFFQHMLETSFQYIPEPHDSERPKHYMPKQPFPSPSYYPQTPHPALESQQLFEKFDVDTLFFIFYYQQGTFQQYLAARELKRQSWRFHKKYVTWFQRHEEPKAITDEYEQGTYVYFDYEGSWSQRKKTDFRFDYKWLEDDNPSRV